MATSTVPRGKVEVYNRLAQPIPHGWASDDTGRSSTYPAPALKALAKRRSRGLLPPWGRREEPGGHSGYGRAGRDGRPLSLRVPSCRKTYYLSHNMGRTGGGGFRNHARRRVSRRAERKNDVRDD